jgi:hypothetical protein
MSLTQCPTGPAHPNPFETSDGGALLYRQLEIKVFIHVLLTRLTRATQARASQGPAKSIDEIAASSVAAAPVVVVGNLNYIIRRERERDRGRQRVLTYQDTCRFH